MQNVKHKSTKNKKNQNVERETRNAKLKLTN